MHSHSLDGMTHAAWHWWLFIGACDWPGGQLKRIYPIHRPVSPWKSITGRTEHNRPPLGFFYDTVPYTEIFKGIIGHQINPSTQSAIKIIEGQYMLQRLEF